jgi:flagellar motility protein MotE (MotC chaperone)
MITSLSALQTSEKLFECTKIFEERKGELLIELERIDEQRQSLEALKIATDDILKKKQKRLDAQEIEVNAIIADTKKREKNIQTLMNEIKKTLETIKALKMEKVGHVYAKMKSASAASILSSMKVEEAGKILTTLKPKVVGKILAKMDAKKASELTSYITE